jgi:hypothetical protein
MTNISNTNKKIMKDVYLDMYQRMAAWKKKYKKEPRIIYIKPGGSGDYVSRERFRDMQLRFDGYWKRYGRQPNYVCVVKFPCDTPTPLPPLPTPTTDWILTGLYKQDYQDTSYTCGPSSAQMVFSALGLTFSEKQIASLAGTNTYGTSHQQLYTAMRKLYPKLDIAEYYLSDIGFNGIIKKLKNNCEIILHIQTYPALSKDADGNRVWTNNYGHYIFLVGINPKTQRVRVADPTKGVKDFTYTQITNAINQVRGQKSVMVFYKP